MFPFFPAELLQLQPVRPAGLLVRPVVPGRTHGAFEPDVFSHNLPPPPTSIAGRPRVGQPPPPGRTIYARTLKLAPEPAVRPPSRMGKRRPSAMAIGESGSS